MSKFVWNNSSRSLFVTSWLGIASWDVERQKRTCNFDFRRKTNDSSDELAQIALFSYWFSYSLRCFRSKWFILGFVYNANARIWNRIESWFIWRKVVPLLPLWHGFGCAKQINIREYMEENRIFDNFLCVVKHLVRLFYQFTPIWMGRHWLLLLRVKKWGKNMKLNDFSLVCKQASNAVFLNSLFSTILYPALFSCIFYAWNSILKDFLSIKCLAKLIKSDWKIIDSLVNPSDFISNKFKKKLVFHAILTFYQVFVSFLQVKYISLFCCFVNS